jgi:hypothetical protein
MNWWDIGMNEWSVVVSRNWVSWEATRHQVQLNRHWDPTRDPIRHRQEKKRRKLFRQSGVKSLVQHGRNKGDIPDDPAEWVKS